MDTSTNTNDEDVRSVVFRNTVTKAAAGFGVGVLLGSFIFKRTYLGCY